MAQEKPRTAVVSQQDGPVIIVQENPARSVASPEVSVEAFTPQTSKPLFSAGRGAVRNSQVPQSAVVENVPPREQPDMTMTQEEADAPVVVKLNQTIQNTRIGDVHYHFKAGVSYRVPGGVARLLEEKGWLG